MIDNPIRPVFAVCVANDGCDDLSTGMLYRVLPDDMAAAESLMRIIDDSGEDYSYPSHRFVIVAERPEVAETIAVMVRFQEEEGPSLGRDVSIRHLINEGRRE